jgi:uncharacterized protein YkwD
MKRGVVALAAVVGLTACVPFYSYPAGNSYEEDIERVFVSGINDARFWYTAPPLQWDGVLGGAARDWAQHSAECGNYCGHRDAHAWLNAHPDFRYFAETISIGDPGTNRACGNPVNTVVADIIRGLQSSPPHWSIVTAAKYRLVGVKAICLSNTRLILVANYGTRG